MVWLILGGLILIVLVAGGIYYWLQKTPNSNTALTQNIQPTPSVPSIKEQLVIGTDATFPPMEMFDGSNNLVGYDIDLGNKIGEKLNTKVEFKNIPWDQLFTSLESGDVDMVISGVTINDERKQTYDFSEPYLNNGQVVIVQRINQDINSVNDLQGKKIAVQKGTTNEEQAYNYTDKQLVLAVDNFIQATELLVDGTANAVFSDLAGAKGIINDHPELKIVGEPFTSEYYGIMFAKGNQDLVSKVNDTLDNLRQEGVLVFLKQKWLE